jgi:hypothetical protein
MSGGGWLTQIAAGTIELTAESLHLHRRPRSEELAAARGALSALVDLEAHRTVEAGRSRELDARTLYDPRLIAQKEPLRRYPPVRVRCRCGRGLEWIAVAPQGDHGLQLVHGPRLVAPKERRGGAYDIVSGVKTSPFGPGSATGTVTWAKDSEAGIGNSRTLPNGPYGDVYALKAHYRCPSCHFEATLLHISLLRLFLGAVLAGDKEIKIGPLPGVATRSTPRTARVEDHGGAWAWSTKAGGAAGAERARA